MLRLSPSGCGQASIGIQNPIIKKRSDRAIQPLIIIIPSPHRSLYKSATMNATRNFLLFSHLIFFFCCTAQDSGQSKPTEWIPPTDTVSMIIHFDTDKYLLTEKEAKRLEDFLNYNWSTSNEAVYIQGHTDSDAGDAYNERLSERRCKSVREAIAHLWLGFDSIYTLPYGERKLLNSEVNDGDKALNRRVEVMILSRDYAQQPVPVAPDPPCPDTLVILPQGTMIQVNRCYLEANPDCIKITEFVTPEAAREAGMTTMDNNGLPLESAGMLKYDLCPEARVQAYIPINENCPPEDMDLYQMDEDGAWQKIEGEKPKPVEVNGIRYYSFPISGSGVMNCDKLRPVVIRPPKMIFKAKQGLRLSEVRVSCDCPFTILAVAPKRKSGKKVVTNRVCCPELQIAIEAVDKNGNPVSLDYGPIGRLEGRRTLIACKAEDEWNWFIFKKRRRVVYRAYKVRPKHFQE